MSREPASTGTTISERLVAQIDPSSLVEELLIVSPDSRRVAYVARLNNKQFVVVDGEEGKQCDVVTDFAFSPDSRRVAYVAVSGGKWSVVVDGKEGKRYDGVVGGAVFDAPGTLHYVGLEGNSIYLVQDAIG